MRRSFAVLMGLLVMCASAQNAEARRHHASHPRQTLDANGSPSLGAGVIISKKTGATARVGAAYAAMFQAYIDDVENHGASVRFMGGIRRGHCWVGGLHPCGKALDVCQLSRGRVDARCHLPDRSTLARIASAHGLFEGGRWCHSDYGHAQIGETAAACGSRPTTLVASARVRTRRIATAQATMQATVQDPVFMSRMEAH